MGASNQQIVNSPRPSPRQRLAPTLSRLLRRAIRWNDLAVWPSADPGAVRRDGRPLATLGWRGGRRGRRRPGVLRSEHARLQVVGIYDRLSDIHRLVGIENDRALRLLADVKDYKVSVFLSISRHHRVHLRGDGAVYRLQLSLGIIAGKVARVFNSKVGQIALELVALYNGGLESDDGILRRTSGHDGSRCRRR